MSSRSDSNTKDDTSDSEDNTISIAPRPSLGPEYGVAEKGMIFLFITILSPILSSVFFFNPFPEYIYLPSFFSGIVVAFLFRDDLTKIDGMIAGFCSSILPALITIYQVFLIGNSISLESVKPAILTLIILFVFSVILGLLGSNITKAYLRRNEST